MGERLRTPLSRRAPKAVAPIPAAKLGLAAVGTASPDVVPLLGFRGCSGQFRLSVVPTSSYRDAIAGPTFNIVDGGL